MRFIEIFFVKLFCTYKFRIRLCIKKIGKGEKKFHIIFHRSLLISVDSKGNNYMIVVVVVADLLTRMRNSSKKFELS